jgi:hypothetical protein
VFSRNRDKRALGAVQASIVVDAFHRVSVVGFPRKRPEHAVVNRRRLDPQCQPYEERRHEINPRNAVNAKGCTDSVISFTKTKLLPHVPAMTTTFTHSAESGTFPMA